jgi:hypothetical protein
MTELPIKYSKKTHVLYLQAILMAIADRNLNNTKLAAQCNVCAATVGNWLRDIHFPRLHNLQTLSIVLDIVLSSLVLERTEAAQEFVKQARKVRRTTRKAVVQSVTETTVREEAPVQIEVQQLEGEAHRKQLIRLTLQNGQLLFVNPTHITQIQNACIAGVNYAHASEVHVLGLSGNNNVDMHVVQGSAEEIADLVNA